LDDFWFDLMAHIRGRAEILKKRKSLKKSRWLFGQFEDTKAKLKFQNELTFSTP